MFAPDVIGSGEIGQRPSHALHPVKSTGGEPARAHRFTSQSARGVVEPAVRADLRHCHLRVAPAPGAGEPRAHALACRGDSLANDAGRLASLVAERLVRRYRPKAADYDQ
jgi:hypothetical protein